MSGAPMRRWRPSLDTGVAWAIGAGSFVLLLVTATNGFVRDEGYYFRAAAEYHAWFVSLWHNLWAGELAASFSDAALTRAFGYNTEHPGLVKILMGFTHALFHDWLGVLSPASGYRAAAIGLNAVGLGFTYLLGARMISRPVGLLAVALLLASPHYFYHAHLACFDGPITALSVVVTYAFWRAPASRRWLVGCGVAFGLALSVKHNAVFLLPTLALATLLAQLDQVRGDGRGGFTLPPIPWAFVAMAVLGPVILYLTYPYGWHAPLERLGAYYRYHLQHEHYPVDFFGTLYVAPPFPWSFPFVMSGLTVPLMVLAPGVVGLACWLGQAIDASWRRRREMVAGARPALDAWLVVLSTVVPPLIIAVPTVPIFGGTKHWLPMMPFFCLLAAWTVWQGLAWLRARAGRVALAAGVALVLAGPVYETARTHPFGHTSFNELAGGHQGGAALGMPRTFWGGDARALLSVLNQEAARGATVFTHRMNHDDFRAYQREGLLRADLRWLLDVRQADWVLVNHQREYQDDEYRLWAATGDRRPIASVAFDGVPIVSLYRGRAVAERPRALLVVLDGLGLAPPGPSNAVARALAERPEGLLARALVRGEQPWVSLCAAGPCAGLPEGVVGNSEAGHGALGAGRPVEQARTFLDRLFGEPPAPEAEALRAEAAALVAAGRPLHAIVYLGAGSSVGHYAHALALVRWAKAQGLPGLQLHAICDGRSPGGCAPLVAELQQVIAGEGFGTLSTLAGRSHCLSRTGVDDAVRGCAAALGAPRTGGEPEAAAVLAALASEHDAGSRLLPQPLAGGLPLGEDDTVLLLTYRRDVSQGLVRLLRRRPLEHQLAAAGGPRLVTVAALDEPARYADDPRLVLAAERARPPALVHEQLVAAGYRQLRLAESAKAAHVTYFFDGAPVPSSATYRRFHPPSLPDDPPDPCLMSAAVVRAASAAVRERSADFVLVNLPNADILGHGGRLEPTVAAVDCADALLAPLVREASAGGYAVFVTADHGNAERVDAGARLHGDHTTNPVPLIAIAPAGQPAYRLRQLPDAGLADVAGTVLDALGLDRRGARSLLER